jgi:hypothetical protein
MLSNLGQSNARTLLRNSVLGEMPGIALTAGQDCLLRLTKEGGKELDLWLARCLLSTGGEFSDHDLDPDGIVIGCGLVGKESQSDKVWSNHSFWAAF